MIRFRDRREAGRALGEALQGYAGRHDVTVLALPRGGVPVGFEVARALHAPLDVFVVRKLGLPGHEELAMGAIASGGVQVVNSDVVASMRVPAEALERVAESEWHELRRREMIFRGDRAAAKVHGRTVLVVDDGLATGSTMKAAVRALRRQHPARIVVAVPVAAASSCEELRAEADEVVCVSTPEPFYGVGLWYQDFTQTTDDEVRELLDRAASNGVRPDEAGPNA